MVLVVSSVERRPHSGDTWSGGVLGPTVEDAQGTLQQTTETTKTTAARPADAKTSRFFGSNDTHFLRSFTYDTYYRIRVSK